MQLHIGSDAAYLVALKVRSRAGGYHYLGNKDGTLFNGPIFILAKVIKAVMSSAVESEVGGLYLNAREAICLTYTIEELRHIQDPVPIKTDNFTANGIINKTVKLKRAKAFDMRFWWLVDRNGTLFKVYWAPGDENLADYFTKNHRPSHHRNLRPIYVYEEGKIPSSMQGCVEILKLAHAPRHKTNNLNVPTTQHMSKTLLELARLPTAKHMSQTLLELTRRPARH